MVIFRSEPVVGDHIKATQRERTFLASHQISSSQWQAVDSNYSVSEFEFKLWNWKAPRRFVVVREQGSICKVSRWSYVTADLKTG